MRVDKDGLTPHQLMVLARAVEYGGKVPHTINKERVRKRVVDTLRRLGLVERRPDVIREVDRQEISRKINKLLWEAEGSLVQGKNWREALDRLTMVEELYNRLVATSNQVTQAGMELVERRRKELPHVWATIERAMKP